MVEMSILNQLNSVPMYLICGGIVAFVAAVCVVFLIRAYRAGKALLCIGVSVFVKSFLSEHTARGRLSGWTRQK